MIQQDKNIEAEAKDLGTEDEEDFNEEIEEKEDEDRLNEAISTALPTQYTSVELSPLSHRWSQGEAEAEESDEEEEEGGGQENSMKD